MLKKVYKLYKKKKICKQVFLDCTHIRNSDAKLGERCEVGGFNEEHTKF